VLGILQAILVCKAYYRVNWCVRNITVYTGVLGILQSILVF
jgi:hypothetical protein